MTEPPGLIIIRGTNPPNKDRALLRPATPALDTEDLTQSWPHSGKWGSDGTAFLGSACSVPVNSGQNPALYERTVKRTGEGGTTLFPEGGDR